MTAARVLGAAIVAAPLLSGAAIGAWWAVRRLCRPTHRWTRWCGSLVEHDSSISFNPGRQWRICRRCGDQQERKNACV
ncbi:hypothetical protein ACIO1C_29520 [Streptomyces sp. NPDC087420]|uniref:hypothetical protein n=1 Tax=Streptomyces sp. NPDC087420 TaxID=3365785 RepID=UPI003833B08A